MGGKLKWPLATAAALALAGAYVYVGVDVRPHEEYVPDPVLAMADADSLPAPPSINNYSREPDP